LQAAEKGLKRLMEAHEWLQKLQASSFPPQAKDTKLEADSLELIASFDEFMNDDLNTAKVLASMFELVPVINGLKDKHIAADALSSDTIQLLQTKLKLYIEDIFGLKSISGEDSGRFNAVMQILIELRKDAKSKKDFVTSDKIRNQLAELGIQLKDEKDGGMSYSL
jgi:cysteinyl-tRNA synthetase